MKKFMERVAQYAPHFKGLTPVDEAVWVMRGTWERASIEGGFAGSFVSHNGDQQWI